MPSPQCGGSCPSSTVILPGTLESSWTVSKTWLRTRSNFSMRRSGTRVSSTTTLHADLTFDILVAIGATTSTSSPSARCSISTPILLSMMRPTNFGRPMWPGPSRTSRLVLSQRVFPLLLLGPSSRCLARLLVGVTLSRNSEGPDASDFRLELTSLKSVPSQWMLSAVSLVWTT